MSLLPPSFSLYLSSKRLTIRTLAPRPLIAMCSLALLSFAGCQPEAEPKTDSEDSPAQTKTPDDENGSQPESSSPESNDSKNSEDAATPEPSKDPDESKDSDESDNSTTPEGSTEDTSSGGSEKDPSEDPDEDPNEEPDESSTGGGSQDDSSDSAEDGTGYPENNRDCDKVSWGPLKGALNVGATLPRQEVPGFYDSDGDNRPELDKEVTVGTCAMHLTGRKCGIIVAGRKG